uniref:Uncharacterized protein n=1 Tax=Cynoglossus semilaevis TaxID=244447 RepID=A0A3P8WCA4_CYNSE
VDSGRMENFWKIFRKLSGATVHDLHHLLKAKKNHLMCSRFFFFLCGKSCFIRALCCLTHFVTCFGEKLSVKENVTKATSTLLLLIRLI